LTRADSGELSRRTGTREFTARDLTLLAEKAPEAYRELMAEKRNWRRLAWADLIAQTVGHLSGLGALVILAAISWHAIDRGAATQGASIICTGAVSIVAVFVTGRLTSGRTRVSPGETAKPAGPSDSSSTQ
jgi:hypothetical protein